MSTVTISKGPGNEPTQLPPIHSDAEILVVAKETLPEHEDLRVVHEHGKAWVICPPCGAIWSAGNWDCPDLPVVLEGIEPGDDSCAENARR